MVGIIPKPVQKAPPWHNLGIYIALGLVAVVVLGYAVLFYLQDRASDNLGSLEQEISQIGTKEERNVEAQVLFSGRRIDDFSKLFQQHKKTSNLLKLLEENCHPQVWVTEMDLLTNDNQANLSGKTPTFQTLGQQMLLFQKQSLIKDASLISLAIGKGGEAEFALSLFFDPAIFK